MIRHELLNFLFSIPAFCIAEELGEIDGIVANDFFIDAHQLIALQVVEKLFFCKEVHQDLFKQRSIKPFSFLYSFGNRGACNQFFDDNRIVAFNDIKIDGFVVRVQIYDILANIGNQKNANKSEYWQIWNKTRYEPQITQALTNNLLTWFLTFCHTSSLTHGTKEPDHRCGCTFIMMREGSTPRRAASITCAVCLNRSAVTENPDTTLSLTLTEASSHLRPVSVR